MQNKFKSSDTSQVLLLSLKFHSMKLRKRILIEENLKNTQDINY